MLLQDMWGIAHMGSVWFRSFWKPREPARSTQDALATKMKGKPEVRRELVPRKARKAPAVPLPILECRRVSWLMVLVEKMVPSGLMLGFFPRCLCRGKAATFLRTTWPAISHWCG